MTQYNQCLPGSLHTVCCNYSFNSCFCIFFYFFFPNIYFSISKSKYYFQPNVILPLPWPQTQRGERFHLRAVQLSRERSPAAAGHQESHSRAGTRGRTRGRAFPHLRESPGTSTPPGGATFTSKNQHQAQTVLPITSASLKPYRCLVGGSREGMRAIRCSIIYFSAGKALFQLED